MMHVLLSVPSCACMRARPRSPGGRGAHCNDACGGHCCRALSSAWRARATPPQHMLNAIHGALRGGLQGFDVHNTAGQSGLLSCLARLFPGASLTRVRYQ